MVDHLPGEGTCHVARHCTHVSLSKVQTVLYITTSAVPVLATDNILLDL